MHPNHRLKILKSSGHLLNTSIFVLLSVFFLHMVGAKYLEISGFSLKALDFSLRYFSLYVPLGLICIYSMGKFKHYSSRLLLFYMFSVWAGALWLLYISHLDKILLALIFFEVLISFYFYQLWDEELHLACHNPDFTIYDLDTGSFHQIRGEVEASGKVHHVIFSNWDERSCFVKLSEPMAINGEVKLKLKYSGQTFEEVGKVVSEYSDYLGVGIKLESSSQGFNWKNFYEVIHERGVLPVWVK